MLGVFELRLPGIVENAAGSVTTREGLGGAFLNGLLATALATPCTAPLLGPAVGLLVSLPPFVAGAGIMIVGLGLAAPYLLLTAFPVWLRFVPRPGKWMITFKQFMGFLLMATVVWLLWILQYLTNSNYLVATTGFLVLLSISCWMIGKLTLLASPLRSYATWATAVAISLVGWYGSYAWLAPNGAVPNNADHAGSVAGREWRPWKPGLDADLASEGFTVYVDFTAKWCTTCQANKAVVLHSDAVWDRMDRDNVVRLSADFTHFDPAIQTELRKYQRAGVPLNIVIPANRPQDVILLPELLTQQIVLGALDRAGASKRSMSELAQTD
jgi:thiol:disulfide interchange protein DsbD